VVISPDNAPPSRLLLEQEASYDPKVSRTTPTASLNLMEDELVARLSSRLKVTGNGGSNRLKESSSSNNQHGH
jgi:hypothetical protein